LRIKLDHLRTFSALTPNQEKFFEIYRGGAYFMGLFGSPGVGKTFLACYKAIEEVLQKDNSFERVVIVRSAVQTRDSGFVPGDLNEKNEIYEQPYKEIFSNLFGRNDAYERLKEQGYIRFITTTAIRGISVDDAIIIVDESQSM
jgi:phosphate starvation-inducible PhoH-like protein